MVNGPKPSILLGTFFIRSVEIEGVGNLIRGLSEEFALRGHHVTLVLPEGEYRGWDQYAEIRRYRTGTFGGHQRYLHAISQESAKVDMVLLMESCPTLVGSYRASRCPRTWINFITPLASLGLIGETGLCRQAVAHALAKSPLFARLRRWDDVRCIVASGYQAAELRGLGARDVNVLPCCGVSGKREVPDRREARRRLGWDDRPVVGHVGHFSRIKGVDVLVEAFYHHHSPAILKVAHSGKGRLTPKAQRMYDEMRANRRLEEFGKVDPVDFLAACDVVCLPYVTSDIFHQPQVLVESFAGGTAVITTSLGGFGELVVPGSTGQLVAPRNVPALSRALEEAVADLPAVHAMGQSARARFEHDLSRESFVDRFLAAVDGGMTHGQDARAICR